MTTPATEPRIIFAPYVSVRSDLMVRTKRRRDGSLHRQRFPTIRPTASPSGRLFASRYIANNPARWWNPVFLKGLRS